MTDRVGLNLFLLFILVTGLAAAFSATADHYLTIGVLILVGALVVGAGIRFAFHELAWWLECREMDRNADRYRATFFAARNRGVEGVEKVSLVKETVDVE